MYKRNAQGWSKHIDFILLDIMTLLFSYILASYIRHHTWPFDNIVYRNLGLALVLIDLVVMMFVNTMHDVLKRGLYKEFVQTVKHCIVVFAFATLYMFALQTGGIYSRILLFVTFLFHVGVGYIIRLLWKSFLKKRGNIGRNKGTILVVLDNRTADSMMMRLQKNKFEGYELAGVVLNEGFQKDVCGVPVVSNLQNAADYISQRWIDAVYVDCPSTDPKIQKLMAACQTMAVPTYYHIPAMSQYGGKQFVEKVAGTTVLTTSINYATPVQLFLKRGVDILGGIVGSIIALLIMVIVGPMIKMKSPGPILFTQTRIGRNGKKFKMFKLRSMHLDAEERKQELWKESRGAMFKLDFDPRIIGNEILPDGTKKTGIGEFIRKTSLDEFPQFFNVLLGQMSLVGTRPPTVDEWERYEYHHRARLACKPGITGMWQVSGRSEITDFEEVVRLDTEYITHWDMGLDFKIIFKTVWIVLTGRGAM